MIINLISTMVIAFNLSISNIEIYNPIKLSSAQIEEEEKLVPKDLTFTPKAITHKLKIKSKLPKLKYTKFELSSETSNSINKIKIPEKGGFKITFEKGAKFEITDRDATDGNAIVQLPESVMNAFIKVQDEVESNTTKKLVLEDKLYYSNQELKNDTNSWYQIGKRPFPVPNSWYSEDGNKYVLRFNNSGIKKAEFRWFKADKVEFPNGIKEIGTEGGIVELKGVGRIELPQGALKDKTVVVLKEELQSKEIVSHSMHGDTIMYDPASPLMRIEPLGLKLNKPALVYVETDKARLGNNHPGLMRYEVTRDKNEWFFSFIKTNTPLERYQFTSDMPTEINKFWIVGKFIQKDILPNSGIGFYTDSYYEKESQNNFKVSATSSTPSRQSKHFLLDKIVPSKKYLYFKFSCLYMC